MNFDITRFDQWWESKYEDIVNNLERLDTINKLKKSVIQKELSKKKDDIKKHILLLASQNNRKRRKINTLIAVSIYENTSLTQLLSSNLANSSEGAICYFYREKKNQCYHKLHQQLSLQELEFNVNALGLSEITKNKVRNLALKLYESFREQKSLEGKSIDYMMAACVYYSCRFYKIDKTMKDFKTINPSVIDARKLYTHYRALIVHLRLKNPVIKTELFLNKFIKMLNVPREIKSEALKTLKKIPLSINNGVNPKGIAIAVLFYACKKYDKDVCQTELAKMSDVSNVTISKYYQKIVKALSK